MLLRFGQCGLWRLIWGIVLQEHHPPFASGFGARVWASRSTGFGSSGRGSRVQSRKVDHWEMFSLQYFREMIECLVKPGLSQSRMVAASNGIREIPSQELGLTDSHMTAPGSCFGPVKGHQILFPISKIGLQR